MFITVKDKIINTDNILYIEDFQQTFFPVGGGIFSVHKHEGCSIFFKDGKKIDLYEVKSKDILEIIQKLEK
jgi:hypothetical protein